MVRLKTAEKLRKRSTEKRTGQSEWLIWLPGLGDMFPLIYSKSENDGSPRKKEQVGPQCLPPRKCNGGYKLQKQYGTFP